MSIAAMLPWWLSLVLAVVSFVALRWVALSPVPTPSGVGDMGTVVVRQMLVTGAQLGQYLVPVALLVGAVVSQVQKMKAARLIETFGDSVPSSREGGARPEMTWREFEALVGEAYRRQGWRVAETDSGPDGGVDLVLRRGDERLFVQCKHWRAQRVSVKVVRELKGVVAQAGATGGAVVTSGRFTKEAVAFAQAADITLLDGVELQRLAKEVHRTQRSIRTEPFIPDITGEESRDATPNCPQCGAAMLLREAKRGANAGRRFWGCREFPNCRGTRPIVEQVNVESSEKSRVS